jgi:hypothetical protein
LPHSMKKLGVLHLEHLLVLQQIKNKGELNVKD